MMDYCLAHLVWRKEWEKKIEMDALKYFNSNVSSDELKELQNKYESLQKELREAYRESSITSKAHLEAKEKEEKSALLASEQEKRAIVAERKAQNMEKIIEQAQQAVKVRFFFFPKSYGKLDE